MWKKGEKRKKGLSLDGTVVGISETADQLDFQGLERQGFMGNYDR